MHKYRFENDYSELCHPAVIEALGRMGTQQFAGYSQDVVSQEAVALLRDVTGNPDAGVYFLTGGTQANLVGLGWMLSPIGAVIAADTGHINVYEAGAIEATGHKVCTVPHRMGKLDLDAIEELLEYHQQEELVTPEVVFLSQSTELGTIYRKSELEGIRAFCDRWNLLLFIDGARIGAAVTSDLSDVRVTDIADLADAFFIGGTKNGALFGEALITVNPKLDRGFRSFIRQRGAMLAKGYAVGVQFRELFRDGLYFELARHANETARALSDGIGKLGYHFWQETESNQVFPVLPNDVIAALQKLYSFHVWDKFEKDQSVVRLVTSWATPAEKIEDFLSDLPAA
jgi:threonine aldolase